MKIILLISMLFVFKVKADAEIEFPQLFISFGMPYIEIQSDKPKYLEDFFALNLGATLQYMLDEDKSLAFNIDASFNSRRKDLRFVSGGKVIEGDASLLVSFYSFSYYQRLKEIDDHGLWLSVGPALGLYTLNFDNFSKNETEISKINRIRVRNLGYRLSLKYMPKLQDHFVELTYYRVIEEKLTVIDDSSNDARGVSENNSIDKRSNQAVIISYGHKLF